MDLAQIVARTSDTGLAGTPLAQAGLAAPVPSPGKILALAGNYQGHVRESGRQVADRTNSTPRVFIKPVTTVS